MTSLTMLLGWGAYADYIKKASALWAHLDEQHKDSPFDELQAAYDKKVVKLHSEFIHLIKIAFIWQSLVMGAVVLDLIWSTVFR